MPVVRIHKSDDHPEGDDGRRNLQMTRQSWSILSLIVRRADIGATRHEIALATGINRNGIGARLMELSRAGLVKDSETYRQGPTKRSRQAVWIATNKGIEAVGRHEHS